MAQSGYTPILIYASGSTGNTPSAANLTSSASGAELALNYFDGKLFYKDASGNVQVLASKAGNINVSSFSAGTTGFTPSSATTGAVTLSGTLATTNGGTGLTSFTANQVFYASSTSAFAQSTNLQFNGTTLTTANDASIHGLTVGLGAGSVSTNTAVGNNALSGSNTGGSNSAFGQNSLQLNTSGINNVAIGTALLNNTTGSNNTGVGYIAGLQNTTGSNNTAIGEEALRNNTTASNNTAVGYQAGYSASASNYNVFIGQGAGYNANYSGSAINTFVGTQAGYYITSGIKNTIIGNYSGNFGGLDIRTSSNYIVLSDGDGNPRVVVDGSGNTAIGATGYDYSKVGVGLSGTGSYSYFTRNGYALLVNRITTTGTMQSFTYNGSGVGTIDTNGSNCTFNSISDYRLKENITPMSNALARVSLLKPVTYKWKKDGQAGEGFIAHELQEVCPEAVVGTKDAVDEEGNPVYQAIDQSVLVATLTASIQELSAKVTALEAKVGI